jgi:hypothetical protein
VDEKRGQKEERCSPLPKNSACFSKIESLHCSYGCAFRLFLEIQGLTRLLISREVILPNNLRPGLLTCILLRLSSFNGDLNNKK